MYEKLCYHGCQGDLDPAGVTSPHMLADELGVHSYDKRILTLASPVRLSGTLFREADETLNGGLITKQLQALPKHHAPTGGSQSFTSDDRLFDYQKIIIEKLAASESCVIVGKYCRLYPEGL